MGDDRQPAPGPGRLSNLLATGRLDSLLRTGGLTVGCEPAADDAERRAARRAELDRVFSRDGSRPWTSRPPAGPPTTLDAVLGELALPAPPRLERRTADRGRLTTLTWRYPSAARHGDWAHAAALEAPTADLGAVLRDVRLAEFRIRDTLFLDIESTGLSHGAGTYAFLVGLAWFEADALVVEQLFLEDPSDEAALLDHFTARRASRPFLASFNGRCYDVHVLHSRLVLNRVCDETTSALRLTPHVDLLHFARAVHGGRFENNRLQTLEREVLGFRRGGGDVPGELIPGLYFQYLQTSDVAPLVAVFRHNAWDVLSMVGLYAHLCHIVACDGAGAGAAPEGDAAVGVNLGRLWLQRGDCARAERVLAAALAAGAGLERDTLRRGLADHVVALKRCLRDAAEDGAVALARRLRAVLERLAQVAPDDPEPHIELSRLHERRTRDAAAALWHAEVALTLLPPTTTAAERATAERRLARLRRHSGS